jgi:hypothetical protein
VVGRSPLKKNPESSNPEYYRRNILMNNEEPGDFGFQFAEPATDGLPTRGGGGALRSINQETGRGRNRSPPYKPATLYPVEHGATLRFYNAADQRPTSPIWSRIDMRAGATKGFAYCQAAGFGTEGTARLFPNYKNRPRHTLVDSEIVSIRYPTEQNNTALHYAAPIFERDQFLIRMVANYK